MADQEGGSGETGEHGEPSTPILAKGEEQAAATTDTHRDQNKKPSNNNFDRDLVRWTGIVAVFTGLLFIAAVLQFFAIRGQQTIMQGQLDESRAEQRPWIRIDSVSVKRLYISDTEVRATIIYNLANVGHKPAFQVFVDDRIEPGWSQEGKELQVGKYFGAKDLCLNSGHKGVFDAFRRVAKDLGVKNIDISESDIKQRGIIFPEGKDAVENETTAPYDKFLQLFGRGPNFVGQRFILVSCVTYTEPFNTTPFHTGTSTEIVVQRPLPLREGNDLPEGTVRNERPKYGWGNHAD